MPKLTFRILRSVHEVSAADWDLLAPRHVFTSHAWLAALEDSGLVAPGRPLEFHMPALLDADGRLLAAAPGVLRNTTAGDFGPENLWIRTARKQGINLLPKLQIELPPAGFQAPKLLVRADVPHTKAAHLLLRAMVDFAGRSELQTVTISRMAGSDQAAAQGMPFVTSNEVGSIWNNRNYTNYADFLSRFKAHYRNAIQAERRKFRESGLQLRELRGNQITAAHWDAFFEGYMAVCRKLGSPSQLCRAFLDRIASALGDGLWLFGVFSGDRLLSGSYAIEYGGTLYGGHWSELEFTPHAVFEVGLYRPVEIAIELGLQAVDQGGWGPHKPKRGFVPILMPNAHWIREPAVRAAAQRLAAEHDRVVAEYRTPPWNERYLRAGTA